MQIEHSALRMAASRTASNTTEVHERLRIWVGERPPEAAPVTDQVSISPLAQVRAAAIQAAAALDVEAAQCCEADPLAVSIEPHLEVVRLLLEKILGREVQVLDPATFEAGDEPVAAPVTGAEMRSDRAGFGVEYDYREVRTEIETASFRAEGVIRTTDGREIRIDFVLTMHRSWVEVIEQSIRLGDAQMTDPLVINFGGQPAQLTAERFQFDLTGDGALESIPMLRGGSGYLALDRNGNGRIDEGGELFGPRTQDGWAELAKLDSDGNGWIDHGDEAFGQLRVWIPSADGAGRLFTLAELRIGAIHLGALHTPFDLKDHANESLGRVRSTGIYLSHSGEVGSVQQIDLVV